jgi:hypothetical protein
MSKRLIVLFATVALLMISAVPVSAAPGGVPGPPPGHDKAKDDTPAVDDDEADVKELPEWAKAYGKRIKDEYGVPFGHLQQCADLVDDEPIADAATGDDDDEAKKALESCPEDLEFPEDENGAKAFWVFTEPGLLIVGL